MSKRGVGLLLILTAAIALGALAQDYRFDGLIAAEQTAAINFDRRLRDFEHVVDSLDGSRKTALASGQTLNDWLGRSSTTIDDAEASLANQRGATSDAPTIALLDAASASLDKFKKFDGSSAAQEVHDALTKARTANRQRADVSLQQFGRLRLAMNAVALIFTLAVAIYLGRAVTLLGAKSAPTMAQMLRDLPPPVKASSVITASASPGPAPAPVAPAPAVAAQALAASAASAAASAAAVAASVHRPSANIAAAAELCVDLAKVVDIDDVPALLERASLVLDARGIVVWAMDADGARLRASLSHGYSDKVLAKLRPLQIDADNVTSLACRSLQPQMMNGASTSDPAALAIPLLTGGGCVGVMSVELRHNRPHADLLPVARILGAQFSTLVAPVPELAQTSAR